MAVVTGEADGDLALFIPGKDPVEGLTEHDLRLLEFDLAQRRAMSRRCEARDGIHACAVFPGHPVDEQYDIRHLCRACTHCWVHSGHPEDPGARGPAAGCTSS
jgi:hypothetical protein